LKFRFVIFARRLRGRVAASFRQPRVFEPGPKSSKRYATTAETTTCQDAAVATLHILQVAIGGTAKIRRVLRIFLTPQFSGECVAVFLRDAETVDYPSGTILARIGVVHQGGVNDYF
jgi:hypothetical protein